MQDLSDEDRREVLGEVLMDELKVIREYLEDLAPVKQDVAVLKQDMAEVKSDIKVIKAVVIDHNVHLKMHDREIAGLKTAH